MTIFGDARAILFQLYQQASWKLGLSARGEDVMERLNGIEKLINEPGFTVLLKERVASAKEKYALLENAAGVLEAENLNLKLENFRLKEKVANLERQLAQRPL